VFSAALLGNCALDARMKDYMRTCDPPAYKGLCLLVQSSCFELKEKALLALLQVLAAGRAIRRSFASSSTPGADIPSLVHVLAVMLIHFFSMLGDSVAFNCSLSSGLLTPMLSVVTVSIFVQPLRLN
jgi:hypothetical protein